MGGFPAERVRIELDRANVPSASIAWVRGDGSSGTFVHGVADPVSGRLVDASTAFHLFSGTKLYTATAVMVLVERGLVALDEPIATYLSDLAFHPALTVRHLLTHTSGLADTLRAFLAVHFAGDVAPTTGVALGRYAIDPRKPPAVRARYGNVNYAILGELISRVSGVPFARFVNDAVLAPLGAGELVFEDRGEGTAVGHVHRFSPMLLLLRWLVPDVARRIRAGRDGRYVTLVPYSLDTAAIGGLVGPATGFLPLLREMLRTDDGVLRAHTKREMLSVQARGAVGIVARDGVGLGWKCGRVDARTYWNHEGGGAGFCSETRLYPADGLGLVILLGVSQSGALSRLCHRIAEVMRSSP